jgi:hypothetical protein
MITHSQPTFGVFFSALYSRLQSWGFHSQTCLVLECLIQLPSAATGGETTFVVKGKQVFDGGAGRVISHTLTSKF